jgi:hypothetical protein
VFEVVTSRTCSIDAEGLTQGFLAAASVGVWSDEWF